MKRQVIRRGPQEVIQIHDKYQDSTEPKELKQWILDTVVTPSVLAESVATVFLTDVATILVSHSACSHVTLNPRLLHNRSTYILPSPSNIRLPSVIHTQPLLILGDYLITLLEFDEVRLIVFVIWWRNIECFDRMVIDYETSSALGSAYNVTNLLSGCSELFQNYLQQLELSSQPLIHWGMADFGTIWRFPLLVLVSMYLFSEFPLTYITGANIGDDLLPTRSMDSIMRAIDIEFAMVIEFDILRICEG
ncbi:hypothetical protein Tco_0393417 [Tanacetum coccineum]